MQSMLMRFSLFSLRRLYSMHYRYLRPRSGALRWSSATAHTAPGRSRIPSTTLRTWPNRANAKSYCENYRGGGYSDWRMPTQDELAGLYDTNKTSKNSPTGDCGGNYHLTDLIHLTCCCPWASETRGYEAAYFHFV